MSSRNTCVSTHDVWWKKFAIMSRMGVTSCIVAVSMAYTLCRDFDYTLKIIS